MLTIHKFSLDFTRGSDCVRLPEGGKPLHYAMQDGVLQVWCEVNTSKPRITPLQVEFVRTGHPIGSMAEDFEYKATVMPVEGLVIHIYARLS